jgi:hypothetical protein
VPDTKQTKSIGEHHVCSMLARWAWAPALTRDGLARTDILAVFTRGESPHDRCEDRQSSQARCQPNPGRTQLLHVAERTLGPEVLVRDHRLLESALARPQATAFGADA